ncbi:E3 ubiquitin-protein ligase Siah1-like [Centruroides sculpturatus]|uniref:E3 ubiquitin-protein ligase Siah1-like n=1 Tax=Centruroides sculpturatus TaxID=218467 RepID=UPI000C6CF93B|nr:E3 ubiquitin-protein ligase Siah1-like [Centruroides sculpturatus]
MEKQQPTTSHGTRRTTRMDPSNIQSDLALVALLKCPICHDYMSPPIHQCTEGHLVCSNCWKWVRRCPTCRRILGDYQNATLEKLAEAISLPCRFAENGCQERHILKDRRIHEKNCKYKTCSCPSLDTSCYWEGTYPQILPHVAEKHTTMIKLNYHTINMIIIGLELSQTLRWTTHLTCYHHDFIVQIVKTASDDDLYFLYAIIRFIGNEKEAAHFKGLIEISGRGKTVTWESVPHSIMDDISAIIQNGDCLMLSSEMINHFLENQILSLTAKINCVRQGETNSSPQSEDQMK